MNFKFDLQMFADITTATTKGYYDEDNGWKDTSSDNAITAAKVLAYYDGSTYWVKPDQTLDKNFSGSVRVMSAYTADVTPSENPAPTAGVGKITLKSGGSLTTTTSTSTVYTIADPSTVTGISGSEPVTIENAAVTFSGASGLVAAKVGSYNLSSFSGTVDKMTNNNSNITAITSGSITTSTDFADSKFMGTTLSKSNTLSVTTDSDGKYVYTINAVSSGQAYEDLGVDDAAGARQQFVVTGSSGADSFTTAGPGNVTLSGGNGIDTFTLAGTGRVSIDGGEAGDTVEVTAAFASDSTILTGAGSDSIGLNAGAAATLGAGLYIDLGEGNDTITSSGPNKTDFGSNTTILGGAGKDVIDLSAMNTNNTIELYIEGGADADSIVGNAKITNSTIVGGDGNDTIGGFTDSVTLEGGSGSDYFKLGANADGKANIKDYTFGEDYLAITTGATAIADANKWASGQAGGLTKDGEYGFIAKDGTNGAATITSSAGFYAATLVDTGANKVNVAWVGDSPVTVDASGQTVASVITGTTNSEADLLVGGSKADTIYAGAGDSVYGGAGSDRISLKASTYGVYVGLSTAGGADSVEGFTSGWDIESADALYMMDGSAESLKGGITGTDVTLKSGSATMSIKGTADATDAKLLINDKKVDLIATGKTITVTDDSTIADYYIGTENAGISLKNYTGDLEVNLSNEMFRNITTLEGGAGSTSILGGKAAESLKGGTGESSLYGGAGVDTLVSGDGKTTFFATSESGKDVVTGFVVGADDTSDVLNVSSISKVSRTSSTSFTVNVDNSNSLKVTQKSGDVNSNIQWVSGDASGVAKIGTTGSNNTFSYDTATTNYVGSTKTDTVSLTSGTTDNFNVWLDQTGGMFSSIEVYDLKNTSGDVLMAGKADTKETIIGGKSNTSLWGGAGNTVDVLKSTSGSTTDFFYGLGEGNDSISGSANDTVNLYNINLSDITKADINSGSVVFTTTANNTVTVSGSVGTFKLADGTAWTANYSSKTWSEAQ